MSSWRACSKTASVVALVLLTSLQLTDAYRDGKFGARLVGRIRERRLERQQLRQRALIASNEAYQDYSWDYRDETGGAFGRSAGENGTNSEDYEMNMGGMVSGGGGGSEEERRPPPLPPALLAFKPNPRRSLFEGKILFRFYHR